jgi:CelD/BcsL family acetyltransferase involved in cellulose biosynthesis
MTLAHKETRGADVKIEILTSEAAVAALAAQWQQLQARVGRSPFTDSRWIDAWWRFLGKPHGFRLHVAAGWESDRLVAVAPLAVVRRHGLRRLQWAGAEVFDYCDMLLEDQRHAATLWQAVRRRGGYDLAQLRDVVPAASCLPALSAFASRVRHAQACHIRIDWPTGEAWLAQLSSSTRSLYRRRLRQLEAKGPVRYEVTRVAPLPGEVIDALVRQKTAWCAEHGKSSVFAKPGAAAFFRRLAELGAEAGNLHLSSLHCGEQIVATHLGFVHADTFYWYMPSYDGAFAQVSPGRVMMMKCIGWAIDNGLGEFDFLRGEEDYKNSFANGTRDLAHFAFPGSLVGCVAHWVRAHQAAQPLGLGLPSFDIIEAFLPGIGV